MAITWMPPLFFIFFIITAQFVMLNLVVAVLMKELGDAEKEDAEDQKNLADKAGEGGESTEVEVLGGEIGGEGEGKKRKSFSENMQDGAHYWKRRLSGARQEGSRADVLFDMDLQPAQQAVVPHEQPGKVLLPEDEALAELGEPIVPLQTGQESLSTTPPLRQASAGGSSAGGEDRPQSRSAWGQPQ